MTLTLSFSLIQYRAFPKTSNKTSVKQPSPPQLLGPRVLVKLPLLHLLLPITLAQLHLVTLATNRLISSKLPHKLVEAEVVDEQQGQEPVVGLVWLDWAQVQVLELRGEEKLLLLVWETSTSSEIILSSSNFAKLSRTSLRCLSQSYSKSVPVILSSRS